MGQIALENSELEQFGAGKIGDERFSTVPSDTDESPSRQYGDVQSAPSQLHAGQLSDRHLGAEKLNPRQLDAEQTDISASLKYFLILICCNVNAKQFFVGICTLKYKLVTVCQAPSCPDWPSSLPKKCPDAKLSYRSVDQRQIRLSRIVFVPSCSSQVFVQSASAFLIKND